MDADFEGPPRETGRGHAAAARGAGVHADRVAEELAPGAADGAPSAAGCAGEGAPPGASAPRGDAAAVWEAYGTVAARLRKAAMRVVRDGHEADDVVHDAMVAAHRNAHLLRDPALLEAWLVRIAKNMAATRYRRSRRCRPDPRVGSAQEQSAAPATPRMRAALLSSEPQPEAVVSFRETLDGVPAEWRAAFEARVHGGLPFERIAEEQGVSVACVKTRISRVRTRLRDCLAP